MNSHRRMNSQPVNLVNFTTPDSKGNATPVVPSVPHVVVPLGREFTQVLAYQGGAYLRTVRHAIKSGGLLVCGFRALAPRGDSSS